MFDDVVRDIGSIELPRWGRVVAADGAVPWLVVGPDGEVVEPVRQFLADFVAQDNRPGSVRSYAYGLLRWWRHHRSRSTEYDLSVDSDFPDASRSRRKTDTGSTIPPPRPTIRYGSWASPVATRRPARATTSRDRSRPCSSSDSITRTS